MAIGPPGDLSKGAQELIQDGTVHISWRVLVVSSAVILAFSIWAIFMPDEARATMKVIVDWIATNPVGTTCSR